VTGQRPSGHSFLFVPCDPLIPLPACALFKMCMHFLDCDQIHLIYSFSVFSMTAAAEVNNMRTESMMKRLLELMSCGDGELGNRELGTVATTELARSSVTLPMCNVLEIDLLLHIFFWQRTYSAASQQLILRPRLIYPGILLMAIELKLYYPIASAVPFCHNLHLFLSAINYLLGFVFGNNMFWGINCSFCCTIVYVYYSVSILACGKQCLLYISTCRPLSF
jgi:hypothetical protein